VKTISKTNKPAQKAASLSKLRKKDNRQLFMLAIPGLLVLAFFSYLPMFGIILPWKNYRAIDGIFGSEWVGWKNFTFFFKGDGFLIKRLLRNTLGLNFMYLMANTIITIILGMMLFELKNRGLIRVYQTVLFLPFIVSWVGASFFVEANLSPANGIINSALKAMGKEQIQWYAEASLWPWILMVCYLWKSIGHGIIIYYGNLMGVDPAQFEAAKLDGANRVQVMWHINWPHLRPIVISFFILSMGSIFSADFGMFYYLPKNTTTLYETTDVIDTYMIRALRSGGNSVGMSAAVGLMQSMAGLAVLLITNKLAGIIDENGQVF
jgi:putative aldouronate transport system permease protein